VAATSARELATEKLTNLLRDRDGQLYELALQLDLLDMEINGLQRLRHEETKQRLDALGIDTSKFKPVPPLHCSELHSPRHVTPDDDIEELVATAKGQRLLDLAYADLAAARCCASGKRANPRGYAVS